MMDLVDIRARADAATRGPWHVELAAETYVDRPSRYPIYSEVRGIVDVTEGDTYVAQTRRGNEQARADAEFIAHAREDMAALLAEVERLRDALRALLADEDGGDPIVESSGDESCFFCGALKTWRAPFAHEPDCAWVAAKALLPADEPVWTNSTVFLTVPDGHGGLYKLGDGTLRRIGDE